ncbi:MAG: FAD:protein FMN transferase [Oscillospiraceae bacterium]|nr:FAD:protein FMN transferase [Oscillospiraceae bacterium]
MFAAAALLAIFFAPGQSGGTGFAMGSALTQTLWISNIRGGTQVTRQIAAALQALEEQLNTAQDPPAPAIELMRASDGAFNPYLGALAALWNIDGESPRVPAREEVAAALQQKQHDPGAYGKGMACDAALAVLRQNKARAAVINLGGNVLTYGRKPRLWAGGGKPFIIALRDPKGNANDTLGVFTLEGTNFISTSGSYEKYFTRGGVRYHHIFDAATGYPSRRDPGLVSVTVVTRNPEQETAKQSLPAGVLPAGVAGDALSTACFVLGYAQSRALLASHGADALFIYEDGSIKPVGQAKKIFTLTNSSYHWGLA